MVRQNLWKSEPLEPPYYPSCHGMELGGGLVIDFQRDLEYYDRVWFRSFCRKKHPVYMGMKTDNSPFPLIEPVKEDWEAYIIAGGYLGGSYRHGLYPVIMSVAANFVIIVFLTVAVFLNICTKPNKYAHLSLKFGSALATINIILFVSRALSALADDHSQFGAMTTTKIMDLLTEDITFTTIEFVVILLLQFCQVMNVMRLFERNVERRLVFFVGMALLTLANVLWSIPAFGAHSGISDSVDWEILTPFVYLFRIAVAASYACILIPHIFTKRKFCFVSSEMAVMTLTTLLVVLLQPALFITDISDSCISDLGEMFNMTCYLGSTVIVWEWLDRLEVLKRMEREKSVLGKPIFEDEQEDYTFAKYALRIPRSGTTSENDFKSFDDNISTTTTELVYEPIGTSTHETSRHRFTDQESINQMKFNAQQSFKEHAQHKLHNVTYKMRDFKGKAKSKLNSRKKNDNILNDEETVRKHLGLDTINDVYVYTAKDIEFDSSDNDHDSGDGGENTA